jgi:electron transfer flavoprotein beta subunit
MKIAVCVKAASDAATGRRLDPVTGRLDRSGDQVLSAYDAHALEEALQIKERTGGGEVVVVSMGPATAQDALRKALAMGADRSVLISDDALAGSDLVGTARAVSGALEREAADLILFGQQSVDGDGACLWAAVAERLRLPVISQVTQLTLGDGFATGRRQTEFGYETIRAPLPAVIAVSDAINEPRYPSLKGIMGAKSKPQEVLSAAEVGGPSAALTTVIAVGPPPTRSESRKLEDDGTAAEAIVAFLLERRLL